MNSLLLLEKIHNLYVLIIVLKEIILDFNGINESNKKQYTGIISLVEVIELGINTIKTDFESIINLQ